jgi:hypothetical protein
MNAVFHNVVGEVRLALGIGEEVAVDVRHVAVVEPIVQVFGEQLGHVNRSGAIVALRRAFLPSGVVQSAGDPEEFALEVDACDFQRRHFADAKAADCGDEKHHLERIGRNVDDSRGGVSVEEKDLRLGFFVSGKHDVPLFDTRDRVAPFSAQVQDRAEGAVDILRGFPPIHAQADCGHERLVLLLLTPKLRARANLHSRRSSDEFAGDESRCLGTAGMVLRANKCEYHQPYHVSEVTVMISPKRMVSVFQHSGSVGKYTTTGDRLSPAEIAIFAADLHGETPIIASVRSPERWFAFTSSRLILKNGEAARTALLADVVALLRPTPEHWAEAKIAGGKIEIQLRDGSVLHLDVESPEPYIGIVNVIMYLIRINGRPKSH